MWNWNYVSKTLVALSLALVLGLGWGSVGGWAPLARATPVSDVPPVTDITPVPPADHDRFAPLGTDPEQALPFWLWLMLPRLFPEYLPGSGGYPSLGMVWEPGQEMPVGFTKSTPAHPRVVMTCAACHRATSSQAVQTLPTLASGASTSFDWPGYVQFLRASARDPRFTPGYLISAISHDHAFSTLEKLRYRFWIIPRTRAQLQELPV
jgi:hypothetical protein